MRFQLAVADEVMCSPAERERYLSRSGSFLVGTWTVLSTWTVFQSAIYGCDEGAAACLVALLLEAAVSSSVSDGNQFRMLDHQIAKPTYFRGEGLKGEYSISAPSLLRVETTPAIVRCGSATNVLCLRYLQPHHSGPRKSERARSTGAELGV